MARPSLKITKVMLTKVEKLAKQGLTLEQIAYCIGINVSTLYKKKAQIKEFREAIKRGQAAGIEKVSNKLFNKAIEGDNTAMIYFLKSRDRDNWGENRPPEEQEAQPLSISFTVAPAVGEIKTTIGKAKTDATA